VGGSRNLGVLASHEGTTLQALIDAAAAGTLPARIVTVISNNADAARSGAPPPRASRPTTSPASRTPSPTRSMRRSAAR